MQRKILYRAALLAWTLISVLPLAPLATAQEDRPQIIPGERKVAKKKESGPRALGVLRITSTGKATLVPIVILIDGKFYDASSYKAAPVPMALDSGTVYEGERTGSSLGLFTVDAALHSNAAGSQTPWIGAGSWVPAGKEVPKTTLKAENVPVGIDNSGDAPPRLTRSGAAANDSNRNKEPSGPTPSSTPPSTSPSTTTPSTTTPTPTPPSTGSKASPPNSPTDASAKDSSTAAAQEKESDSNSGAGDNNRPRLRRGKPVSPLPDEEVPGYSRVGATPASTPTAPADPTKPAAAPTVVPVQLIPAISDAGGPEPRSFTFEWLKGEEDERRPQVMALAQHEIRAYVDAQAKASIPPKPLPKKPTRAKAAKQPDPILDNPQMVTYDLWTNNQPVIVFTADAHLPPPPAGSPQPTVNADPQYSITLVVRTDIYNNLHKLYVGVTDKYHLDLTPHLQLVDAVDVDGDGRGELLFRETSDSGAGWLIYRATTDKLWKLFDSLNPE